MSGGSEGTQPDAGGSSKPPFSEGLEAEKKGGGGGSKDSGIVGVVNTSEAADCSNIEMIQSTSSSTGGDEREQLNTLIEEVSQLLRSYLDQLKTLDEDGSDQLWEQGE